MELTIKPTIKQHKAYEYLKDEVTKYVLFGGAAGGGKTWLGCEWLTINAVRFPDTRYFIAREKLTVLKRTTLITLFKVFKYHGITDYNYNAQTGKITFGNGSVIDLLEIKYQPSDPLFEDLGSSEYTAGWIEEAGEVVFDAFDVLKTRVGRHNNDKYNIPDKIFLTCNPKKNWLYQIFYKPWKEKDLPKEYAFIQSLIGDNPFIERTYIDNLKNLDNSIKKERLLHGNWEYEDDDNLIINYEALTDTFSNTINKTSDKFLIVDVARYGEDSTVFSFWNGLELYKIEKYQKQSTDKTVQQIKDFAASESIPYSNILVDEDGVGGGVVDQLFGIKGFTANSSPIPTASQIRERKSKLSHEFVPKTVYANIKSQCGWKLAELINERKISFKVSDYREMIIEDLSSLLRDKNIDSDQKRRLISKEEIKQDLGRSPDVGDTILMRMLFELQGETGTQMDKEVADKQNSILLANQFKIRTDSTK